MPGAYDLSDGGGLSKKRPMNYLALACMRKDAEIAALRAQLAEAQRDTARLDYSGGSVYSAVTIISCSFSFRSNTFQFGKPRIFGTVSEYQKSDFSVSVQKYWKVPIEY